ncbi:Major facilitator superfamily transporter [Mycena indigotica]|uniref:Major facilitator superfamily transporter n=1 Tax=Mycena indigotica TaxID=2126181 RepID=A0A8H6WFC8_9AGAR|nr:Major facilitator superfamily transporter [Mycena indigotica]KAF7312753.1 Major facilitator superfamily transporter [Mycena indigotica]
MTSDQPDAVELKTEPVSDVGPTMEDEKTPNHVVDDYPHGLKLALLIVALCLSVFLVALVSANISLVGFEGRSLFLLPRTSPLLVSSYKHRQAVPEARNEATAIPHITHQFESLNDVGWVCLASLFVFFQRHLLIFSMGARKSSQSISKDHPQPIISYLLAMASTQLLFGKFYSFLSIKWVYITAVTLFEIGSAVCGAANSSNMLIGGRAIAGLGCAGIFSGGMIILAHAVPLAKRPLYTGIVGMMFGIASVAGPLMGGAFTDKVTWRWCFYINLPVGVVTLFVMIFLFKMPASAARKPQQMFLLDRINQFDPVGTIIFIPCIISLLLALQWGGTKYAWNNGRIIGLFVVFGVLAIAFIAVQIYTQENATVPPRIFKVRSIWSGALFALCLGGGYFIIIFYLPIWFQAIKGVSAVRSGIDNIPMILSVVVGSVLAGGLVTVFGIYSIFFVLSSVLMTIGAGLISSFTTHTGTSRWIGYQVIFGLGVGLGLQQPIIAAQTVLPLADVPVGTTIVMFAQTIGGALFISAGQNVFNNKLVAGILREAPGVSLQSIVQAGATNLAGTISPASLPAVLHAYNDALVAAFRISIAMSAITLLGAVVHVVEWKSVKGKAGESLVV